MIEFVVIFLVVLACCGVLFTVLLFLPKAFPFFADCGSRIRASFVDWRASANWKWEQFRLDGKRRWLERDRLYREQSHLLPGWDWNGLVVSVCCFLVGCFCWWFGRSSFRSSFNRLSDHVDRVVLKHPRVVGIDLEDLAYLDFEAFWRIMQRANLGDFEAFLHTMQRANLFWELDCFSVFCGGSRFCREVLSSILFCGGSLSAHRGSGGGFEGGASASARGRAG